MIGPTVAKEEGFKVLRAPRGVLFLVIFSGWWCQLLGNFPSVTPKLPRVVITKAAVTAAEINICFVAHTQI